MSRYFLLLLLCSFLNAETFRDFLSKSNKEDLTLIWKKLSNNAKSKVGDIFMSYQKGKVDAFTYPALAGSLESIDSPVSTVQKLLSGWRALNKTRALMAMNPNIAESRKSVDEEMQKNKLKTNRINLLNKNIEELKSEIITIKNAIKSCFDESEKQDLFNKEHSLHETLDHLILERSSTYDPSRRAF